MHKLTLFVLQHFLFFAIIETKFSIRLRVYQMQRWTISSRFREAKRDILNLHKAWKTDLALFYALWWLGCLLRTVANDFGPLSFESIKEILSKAEH